MASKKKQSRALIPTKARALSAKEFLDLADVPPEIERFANITNPQTRRAYQNDLKDFMRFARISNPEVLRVVTRAHLIAWRKDLEGRRCEGSTIRRKLSAVSSLRIGRIKPIFASAPGAALPAVLWHHSVCMAYTFNACRKS